MTSLRPTITVEQYETILYTKERQIEGLQAQLQDYNSACQRLENALIQEQLRSKQLLDAINNYKAMLVLKDTQSDELHLRLNNQPRPLSSSSIIPGLLVTEKEVVTPSIQRLERSVSASVHSETEVLSVEPVQFLGVQSQRQPINRSHSFSDKLPVNDEIRQNRASSAITFDALGIPAVTRSRSSAAELGEPKGYSSKPNMRYYGRNEGG